MNTLPIVSFNKAENWLGGFPREVMKVWQAVRWAFVLAVLAVGNGFGALPSAAQDYPSRVATIIVPVPAGGPLDHFGRLLAQRFSAKFNQNFIVENVSGGATLVGTGRVARANPDGYMLLMQALQISSSVSLYPKLNFDIERDLTPVGFLTQNPLVLVGRKSLAPSSLTELIAWMKTTPAKFAHPGNGSTGHLATALFAQEAGVRVAPSARARKITWPTKPFPSWLGKSFDTFAPLGPCIVTADEIPDPNDLIVRLWNNGQLRHNYNTDDMEHRVPQLIEWATMIMTLRTGDLIACGTNHEGLGALQDGEVVDIEIQQIGKMTLTVSDPLKREWPRGVYMGSDSTNPLAVARHRSKS